jgi:hypothetical protein
VVANSISVIEALDNMQSPVGPVVAIMIGVTVRDTSTADALVIEVAEQFKMKRMMSSPKTNALLITLVGEMSATRFAECWRAPVAADEILDIFMSQMRLADVMHGVESGQVLETTSLLG